MIQVARQPFVRTLEYGDAIRQHETVGHAAFGQRPSLIQAKQTASKRTAQPAKLALRGFTFDNHREVNHPCAKAPRDFGQSLFNHLIEFARIHLFPWYHISPLGEWALVLQSSP